MVADFFPASVVEIRDIEAIALLQQMQRRSVEVLFEQGTVAVATAHIHHAPALSCSNSCSTRPPLLLLHGFDSSLLEFRRLLPLLTNQEIWAIDLFGAGFTEYIPGLAVNPPHIRQHLLSVLEAWIAQPVILVGASLGGAVAIDFTLHHPTWVESLVLIDSVGFSGSFPIGQFLPNPLIELGADWLYVRKHAALTAASVLPLVSTTLIDALRCSLLHQEMPGWKGAITSFTQSGGYGNLAQHIAEITCPTLILWGEADHVLGTADAARFAQAILGSRLVWIQQAGHVPHFDCPEIVAAQLNLLPMDSRLPESQIL
jgi:pimeloyl-ACP methyl ester carboxylesterase